ncbi:hypothetical protein [Thalassovita litoralis]|uniref:hypothetical protein n=1 Tax=Thalassovita litoralis TaxID=1010611 RepID=UPI001157D1C5|nr:hypothetical protein [Thalassovita litoralis]
MMAFAGVRFGPGTTAQWFGPGKCHVALPQVGFEPFLTVAASCANGGYAQESALCKVVARTASLPFVDHDFDVKEEKP